MPAERLQKILAQAGIASRRKAEELIQEGSVTVNGRVAQFGDKAELGKDAIKVRGKLLQHSGDSPLYLAFYKPKAVISAISDPEGRPTISDFLSKVKGRVFPIGRLEFNSEGLMILTNDGNFAEQLQKREDIPRVYHVKVKGHTPPEMITHLEKGARIGEEHKKLLKPYSVRLIQELSNKSLIEIVVMGAGAFDVKSLLMIKGFLVDKIVRTAVGHITLKGLKPGHFRFLKEEQVQALLERPELGVQRIEQEAHLAELKKRKSRAQPTRTPVKIIPVSSAKSKQTTRIRPRNSSSRKER